MDNQKVKITVEGMTCTNCAGAVNRYLSKQGHENISVSFADGEVMFNPANDSINLDDLKKGISKLGFTVIEEENPSKPFFTFERKLALAALFTIPLILGHFLMMFGVDFPLLENPWTQFALCLPVFIIGLFHFGKSAFYSMLSGVPNMDVLIFTGSTAAFVYSCLGLVWQDPKLIFFETCATIITLVLLGNWMEKRAVAQTTTAIDELMKLKVEVATKIIPSGELVQIARKDIRIGDLLQVNQGDKIPVDGIIKQGGGALDESMLTGESIPAEKEEGSLVFGGTLLSIGSMQIEVNKNENESAIDQIIDLVKSAQAAKPNIQKLGDVVAAWFVPLVILISLGTFLVEFYFLDWGFTQSLMNAIAVLVISCPCAMGLATPTAVMAGIGRVAKNGILINGGNVLEKLATVKNVVFDKTGTLTTGKFKVEAINYETKNHKEIDQLILSFEQHSSHPIAKSLVRFLQEKGTQKHPHLTDIAELSGTGLSGRDAEGNEYKIGSYLVAEEITDIDFFAVYLRKNDQLLATVELADDLKEGAKETMDFLHDAGITPILLSGDKRFKIEILAEELGIKEYYAEKLPHEKLKIVEQKSKSEPTAMVGDGINDAPALAHATVGVSLSDASQIAIKSAQVILLNGDIGLFTKAVLISRATLRTIKENLFWAFGYNIIAIPMAAMGFLTPMWGALFMAFSDLIVIGNSIRLKYKKL